MAQNELAERARRSNQSPSTRRNENEKREELRKRLGNVNKELFKARAARQQARPGVALTGEKHLREQRKKLIAQLVALGETRLRGNEQLR